MGDLAGAVADLDAYNPIANRDGYAAFWLIVLQARVGKPTAAPAPDSTVAPDATPTPADQTQSSTPSRGRIDAAGLPGYTPDTSDAEEQSGPRRGHSMHERLLQLFAGQAKPTDVLQPGPDGAPLSAADQCDADFFVAEWWLVHGDDASAKPLFNRLSQTAPQRRSRAISRRPSLRDSHRPYAVGERKAAAHPVPRLRFLRRGVLRTRRRQSPPETKKRVQLS
jgi:hypothetical protein